MTADATGDSIAALQAFAKNLGLAFQIIDDLLDVEGDPAVTGKPVREDAKKTTFVSFSGPAGARQLATELCHTADRALQPFGRRANGCASSRRSSPENELTSGCLRDPRLREVDDLRQRLRSLGYLDAGVDRFVLAPAAGGRRPWRSRGSRAFGSAFLPPSCSDPQRRSAWRRVFRA